MRYARTIMNVIRDMTPSADLALKTAIRCVIGLTLLAAPNEWLQLAGKLALFIAAYGLIGHAEAAFTTHAAFKIRQIAGAIAIALAATYFAVALLFPTEDDEPWHQQ